MSWNYSCPKCAAMLNPVQAIILKARYQDRRLLVGFHPQPGNYELYLPPGIRPEADSRWDFSCPVCDASLTSQEDDNLCALDVTEGQEKRRVLFSRVAGEKATFVVSSTGVEPYGPHVGKYHLPTIEMKYTLV